MGRPLRLSIICSGLGRVSRGFESFALETYRAMRSQPGLIVRLFGGPGAAALGAEQRKCLYRDTWLAKVLGAAVRRNGYSVEQVTFVGNLLCHVLFDAPDVILCSEGTTIDALWLVRRALGRKYKMLGSNGGPMGPPFYRVDFVQHVVADTYHRSLAMGYPSERQTLVPYGFDLTHLEPSLDTPTRESRRKALGLPRGRKCLIAVGAVACDHKRADYVVREVARLADTGPQPRPFLLLLGQQTHETPDVRRLAIELLGQDGFAIRTVGADDTHQYYAAADVFVLGSLREAFGRVIVEACAAGLPCLVHDSVNSRYILGEHGCFADFSADGALTELLSQVLRQESDIDQRRDRHAYAASRFSWPAVLPAYVDMVERCAAVAPAGHAWAQRLPATTSPVTARNGDRH